MEATKVQAIKDYLEQHFPDATIDNKDDFDRCGHKFRLLWNDKILLTSITRELADDNSEADLIEILTNYGLPALMKKYPNSIVLVDSVRFRTIPVM